MKSIYFLLIILLFISSCKKEETKKPDKKAVDKEVVSQEVKNPDKAPVVTESVPKPSMDIFAAIDAENVEEIRRNIHHDKSIITKLDKEGDFFPLHYASYFGKTASVKEIVKYCDVNLRMKPELGNVALIYAADQGHFEIVKYLIEKGADVNIIFGKIEFGKKVNSGYTALYAACIDDHYKIAKLLIENGADVNKVCRANFDPMTALDRAAKNDSEKCRVLLTKHGGRKYKDLKK